MHVDNQANKYKHRRQKVRKKFAILQKIIHQFIKTMFMGKTVSIKDIPETKASIVYF